MKKTFTFSVTISTEEYANMAVVTELDYFVSDGRVIEYCNSEDDPVSVSEATAWITKEIKAEADWMPR